MSSKFDDPKTVESVNGASNITPELALKVLYRAGQVLNDGSARADLAALTLLYASRLSTTFSPFDVEMSSLTSLTRDGYLNVKEIGNNAVHVTLMALIP